VSGKSQPVSLTLKIELISGHYIPQPESDKGGSDIVDPYIKIRIDGCEADAAEWTSSVVKDNGFNPRWKGTKGSKPADYSASFKIRRPETAMITFEVWDKDSNPLDNDDQCAVFSCPISAVRPGLRVVPLWDVESVPLPVSNLFVSIAREEASS